jgi:UDP-3-O-[3-hydroxymyristoyl] N-acetylglucosamine deacetylase
MPVNVAFTLRFGEIERGRASLGDYGVGDTLNLGNGAGATARSARQKTLKSSIHCSGIGLHGGEKISMSLHPADIDTGIVFRRSDIRGVSAEIAANFENVHDTRLCTTLRNDASVSVGTVEHLMAALAGCEVDNVEIELSGPEVPIMDGSAEPFVFLIECAGIVEQSAPRRAIQILKPVRAAVGDAVAELAPSDAFAMKLAIDFDNPAIGEQSFEFGIDAKVFKDEISRARTFGFLEDVEALRKAGLALGGSLDNAVVVSGDRILNDGGLRYQDEFVRHKALDCIGDLYLAGSPIIGLFTGRRMGHAINNQLLRALFADSEAWTYTTVSTDQRVSPRHWVETPAAAVA